MRKQIWPWGILLVFALLLAACGSPTAEGSVETVKGFPKNADGYADINVDQLAEMMADKDFALVNVHIPYEGEIPQTDLFIPFNEIDDHLDELPAREVPIVLYCRSGSMSTTAAKVLADEGYSNVMELDGGFNAWKAQGHEFDVQTLMQESVTSQPSAREKLDAVLTAFAAMATSGQFQEMAPLTLNVWTQNWQDPEVNRVVMVMYNRFRALVLQVIEEGIAQGKFEPVDATALASIILALYDGLILQSMIDKAVVDWGAISETLTNTLIVGLLTAESAAERAS